MLFYFELQFFNHKLNDFDSQSLSRSSFSNLLVNQDSFNKVDLQGYEQSLFLLQCEYLIFYVNNALKNIMKYTSLFNTEIDGTNPCTWLMNIITKKG